MKRKARDVGLSQEEPTNWKSIIINSFPGWFYFEPNHEGDMIHSYTREPVIAWEISKTWIAKQACYYSVATPITANGIVEEAFPAMERPNGTIYITDNGDFDSIEAVREHVNASRAKK